MLLSFAYFSIFNSWLFTTDLLMLMESACPVLALNTSGSSLSLSEIVCSLTGKFFDLGSEKV